jgi:predicted phosphodiesterase
MNNKLVYEVNRRGEIQSYLNDFIVIGDLHIPQQDDNVVQMVVEDAKASGISSVIINGDFSNSDVFSEFARKQTNASWEWEKIECRRIMKMFQNTFENIFFILGNHDARLLRKTNYSFKLDDLLRILVDDYNPNQIIATEHDHILVNDNWRVCHPREYSRIAGSKAKQMGEKYGTNTIVGHSHILSHTVIGRDGVSSHYLDGGCALDFDKVEYEVMNTSTFTQWSKGYIKVVNDYPVVQAVKTFKSRKSTVVW